MSINITESINDLPEGVTFPDGMVAIDTETLGLKIKRDRLCVAQLSDGQDNVWLIKFDGTDYSAPRLTALLQDPRILKIFHYARFDVAVFRHYLAVDTTPIYCTKIASKLTRTYTDKHGLKTLVEEIVGEKMDKGEQQSDWSAPMLSESQKHYAACDVIYLHEIKEELDSRLRILGRLATAQACFNFLPTRIELDLMGWEDSDIFNHH